MSPPTDLPQTKSYITTHTEDGSSVYSDQFGDVPQNKTMGHSKSIFADIHHAPTIPVAVDPSSVDNDLKATEDYIATNQKASGIFPGPSTVFRRVDFPPGAVSPMHQTLSVDYGIVLAGEVELTLESGEKRVIKAGDTIIQRATMHQWRNLHETEWCRMVFIMMPTEELVVGGKKLEEEYRFA
jgi:quercetin dioxygenase-like cupin family protein